jgi:hypothetical protein
MPGLKDSKSVGHPFGILAAQMARTQTLGNWRASHAARPDPAGCWAWGCSRVAANTNERLCNSFYRHEPRNNGGGDRHTMRRLKSSTAPPQASWQ